MNQFLRAAPRKYQLDLEIAKKSNFSILAQNEALRALVTKILFYSGYQSHASFDDFFPIQKLSFDGRQSNVAMSRFHGHVLSSLDQVYSLSDYDKVICNFAEMKGYYAEKMWSVLQSHSRNTFCERNVCEEGGFLIVGK